MRISLREITKDNAASVAPFVGADDRVEQVAEFVANHFRENVDSLHYRAFLVAVDRDLARWAAVSSSLTVAWPCFPGDHSPVLIR